MDALNKLAVCLQRNGGRLVILGEDETLTPELLNELSAYKAELLTRIMVSGGAPV
jgi:hypothetical protein